MPTEQMTIATAAAARATRPRATASTTIRDRGDRDERRVDAEQQRPAAPAARTGSAVLPLT